MYVVDKDTSLEIAETANREMEEEAKIKITEMDINVIPTKVLKEGTIRIDVITLINI